MNALFPLTETARDYVLRRLDEFNPKVMYYRNVLDKLKVLEIHLSNNDLSALDQEASEAFQQRFYNTGSKNFRKMSLTYDGKKIAARIALHGTTMHHWSRKKKAFDIKIAKTGDYVERIRKFTLLLPYTRRYLSPFHANTVADELGLMRPVVELIRVKLNGIGYGGYLFEEKIDADFLKRRGKSNNFIVKLSDNWAEDHYTNFFGVVDPRGHHITPFDFEISNIKRIKFKKPEMVYGSINNLFHHIKNEDIEGLKNLVDFENFAKYEAYRTLFGNSHEAAGDNLRMAYSLTDGKFRAIVRSEGGCSPLELRGGSFAHKVNFYNDRSIRIYVLLNQIDEYRKLKYKILHRLIQGYPKLRERFNAIHAQYLDLVLYDFSGHQPLATREKIIQDKLQCLDQNAKQIKSSLESSRVYVNVYQQPGQLEIEILPDSEIPVQFKSFKLIFEDQELNSTARLVRLNPDSSSSGSSLDIRSGTSEISDLLNEYSFMPQFNKNLELEKTTFKFAVRFGTGTPFIKDVHLEPINGITGKKIPERDTYMKIARSMHLTKLKRHSSMEDFKKRSLPGVKIVKDRITFPKGTYPITSDFIIPEGFQVLIEGGAIFLMGKGRSFISFSSVDFSGSEKENIIIKEAVPGEYFGTFAVVGEENRRIKSTVNWVDLRGGSEAFAHGLFFSGGFSFFHADVHINHSRIHDNVGDDGLNIKYGRVNIQNTEFSNNLFDQIDCDFCEGIISNSHFQGGTKNNADGIDLSGSFLKISNNQIRHFKDKGISLGENSHALLVGNEISHSDIGIAVKDLSQAYVFRNRVAQNQTGLSLYQKKPIFGGGNAFLFDNSFSQNAVLEKKDGKSTSVFFQKEQIGKNQSARFQQMLQTDTRIDSDYFKSLREVFDQHQKE